MNCGNKLLICGHDILFFLSHVIWGALDKYSHRIQTTNAVGSG